MWEVYPRVCGGNWPTLQGDPRQQGLSPRVRGKLNRRRAFAEITRSIPACAGETHKADRSRCRSEVYPRVCGGNPLWLSYTVSPGGLSPRVRGKPFRIA